MMIVVEQLKANHESQQLTNLSLAYRFLNFLGRRKESCKE